MVPCRITEFKPQQEVLKAVKYAASSWLVRAKLGVAYLQLTAALEFGGHVLVTAYEGGEFNPTSFTSRYGYC